MNKIVSVLMALAAGLSALAGLDLSGVVALFPEGVAEWALLVPTCAAALLHTVKAIGDLVDDGERNGSFLPLLIFGFVGCFLMVGCEQPTHYEVDVRGYEDAIAAKPEKVLVEAADVTPVGGRSFSFNVDAKLLTDDGELALTEDGVTGTVVIDQRTKAVPVEPAGK